METFLSIFDAIYLINLDERQDRLESFNDNLKSIGVSDDFITNKIKRFSAIKHGDGKQGCIESHITIIKEAKKLGYKNVLVLEDDCEFIVEYLGYLGVIGEDINNLLWDVYYLGYNSHVKLTKIGNNSLVVKECFATHAICYSENIYDNIINSFEKNEIKIMDVWLRQKIQTGYNCLGSLPILCTQTTGLSNIMNEHVDYSYIVVRFKENTKHLTW